MLDLRIPPPRICQPRGGVHRRQSLVEPLGFDLPRQGYLLQGSRHIGCHNEVSAGLRRLNEGILELRVKLEATLQNALSHYEV